jgi:hypothetical protein
MCRANFHCRSAAFFAGQHSLDNPVCPAQSRGREYSLFFCRICHFPILRRAAVTLVALAWSSLAFCGEIHDAAAGGDLEKVKALLKDNPNLVANKDDNLDMNGGTPLYWAARLGHKDMAELLLANKADVNAKDNNDDTPLHATAYNGRKDVAELLRQHGGHE